MSNININILEEDFRFAVNKNFLFRFASSKVAFREKNKK